jgi:hypothetical protein
LSIAICVKNVLKSSREGVNSLFDEVTFPVVSDCPFTQEISPSISIDVPLPKSIRPLNVYTCDY